MSDAKFQNLSLLGLGLSKYGSFAGIGKNQSESLIKFALDNGITYFDTAPTYGQGDSERYLAAVIGRYQIPTDNLHLDKGR